MMMSELLEIYREFLEDWALSDEFASSDKFLKQRIKPAGMPVVIRFLSTSIFGAIYSTDIN
jgi:hypothetical protein